MLKDVQTKSALMHSNMAHSSTMVVFHQECFIRFSSFPSEIGRTGKKYARKPSHTFDAHIRLAYFLAASQSFTWVW